MTYLENSSKASIDNFEPEGFFSLRRKHVINPPKICIF